MEEFEEEFAGPEEEQVENAKMVPIEKIYPNPWNPNVQQDETFNKLVENIEEIGMVEPLLLGVRPKEDDPEKEYVIISGEHRYEACKVLGYEKIPAFIREDFDEDMQKFQTVRMNVIKGELDPVKFTDLFNQLEEKYNEEIVKDMMGFVDEQAFDNVYLDVKENLPKEMQEELEDSKEEIQDVDDLSRILNQMFKKHGDTLQQNFMVFTYGSKTHYWIKLTDEGKKNMDSLAEYCAEEGVDINRVLNFLLEDYEQELDNLSG